MLIPFTLRDGFLYFMPKSSPRYRAASLEKLAKIDPALTNPRKVRKKLRATIQFALETNRPDRAEWCEILLKKFSQTIPKEALNGSATVRE